MSREHSEKTATAMVVSAEAGALRDRKILVLNWRDVRHSQAGGAEQYMHQIARRWVQAGVQVTWMTSREPGAPAREMLDGIEVLRAGGTLSVYARCALRLIRRARGFDAIIDCQNGIPFFSPAFARGVPTVLVIHHVHQDQFATRFPPTMARLGRFLESRASRWVYRDRAVAAVSTSTRLELRRQLRYRAPIFVVPNGTAAAPALAGPRDPDPTIVLVTRMVPHKRVDLLLRQLPAVAARVPGLRVELVGDGPERAALENLAGRLGLGGVVTFRGRLDDHDRDELLRRAWVTTCTSVAEGWGCSVIEAAAVGVPCVALAVPGIRDSVVDSRTGWLVQRPEQLADRLVTALTELADDRRAAVVVDACQAWARCFTWERSAALLAGVVAYQAGVGLGGHRGGGQRRTARSDMATIARFPSGSGADLPQVLRATDQVHDDGVTVTALLVGCDEHTAHDVLARHGVHNAQLVLASRHDLLAGPGRFPGGSSPAGPERLVTEGGSR